MQRYLLLIEIPTYIQQQLQEKELITTQLVYLFMHYNIYYTCGRTGAINFKCTPSSQAKGH